MPFAIQFSSIIRHMQSIIEEQKHMWAIQQRCEWYTIGAKVSMGWTAATWEMVHWCLKQRQRNEPSCLMFTAQKKSRNGEYRRVKRNQEQ